MAKNTEQTAEVVNIEAAAPETSKKPRKERKPSEPKPVFVMFQVLDENNQPMEFNKDRIRLISATKDAAAAITLLEDPENAHASYKRVFIS